MQTTFGISIGNTRIQLALITHNEVSEVVYLEHDQTADVLSTLTRWRGTLSNDKDCGVVIGSVNTSASKALTSLIRDQLSLDIYELELDLPIPIGRSLDPETIIGVDRLLNAAAAWDIAKQACVVVDAGTAVTVDFIDGEGVFHGGAIMPGAQMQLKAMADGTDLLDDIDFKAPEGDAFGRSTGSAMLRGVFHGIRGGVWRIVETYAEEYGAYPLVIATGGDAETLFGQDELITRIVADLPVRGIAVTVRVANTIDDETAS
jgi:type III pantothenate kinase